MISSAPFLFSFDLQEDDQTPKRHKHVRFVSETFDDAKELGKSINSKSEVLTESGNSEFHLCKRDQTRISHL